jgi:hypothetical protein
MKGSGAAWPVIYAAICGSVGVGPHLRLRGSIASHLRLRGSMASHLRLWGLHGQPGDVTRNSRPTGGCEAQFLVLSVLIKTKFGKDCEHFS